MYRARVEVAAVFGDANGARASTTGADELSRRRRRRRGVL